MPFLSRPFCSRLLQVQQTNQRHQGVQGAGPVSRVRMHVSTNPPDPFLFSSPPSARKHPTSHGLFHFLRLLLSSPTVNGPLPSFSPLSENRLLPPYLHPSFTPFSPPSASLSPPLSHLCFYPHYLFPFSPFHLRSHSSAVTVICLLLFSSGFCPQSVKIAFNRGARVFLTLVCRSVSLQRLHAQRETQVPEVGSQGAGDRPGRPARAAGS